MHLALAIKNTILVILIILIVHFMVKNVLLEKPQSKPVQTVPSKPISAHGSEQVSSIPTAETSKTGDIPPSKPSSDEVPKTKQQGLDKAKEELLKFVSDDDDDLDKFFTKCMTTTPSSSDNTMCKSSVPRDPPFPLSTTCDPAIQKLSSSPQATLCAKKTTDNLESKKKVMILQEYDNENSMNGGDLYGGLKPYDTFDDHYQQYSCTL